MQICNDRPIIDRPIIASRGLRTMLAWAAAFLALIAVPRAPYGLNSGWSTYEQGMPDDIQSVR
jgi:hypothetical protein